MARPAMGTPADPHGPAVASCGTRLIRVFGPPPFLLFCVGGRPSPRLAAFGSRLSTARPACFQRRTLNRLPPPTQPTRRQRLGAGDGGGGCRRRGQPAAGGLAHVVGAHAQDLAAEALRRSGPAPRKIGGEAGSRLAGGAAGASRPAMTPSTASLSRRASSGQSRATSGRRACRPGWRRGADRGSWSGRRCRCHRCSPPGAVGSALFADLLVEDVLVSSRPATARAAASAWPKGRWGRPGRSRTPRWGW